MANTLTEYVATRVDNTTMHRLAAEAARLDRTVSAVVRLAIRQYLNGKDTRP